MTDETNSSWTKLPNQLREPESLQGDKDDISHPAPHSTLLEYLALHTCYFGDDHTPEEWIAWAKETLTEQWENYEKKRGAFEKQRAKRAHMTKEMMSRKQEEARKLLMRMWIKGEEQWMEEDESAWQESQTELEREMDEAMDGLKLGVSKSPGKNKSKTLDADALVAIETGIGQQENTAEREEIAWKLLREVSEKEREARENIARQRERMNRERLEREQKEREMNEREYEEDKQRVGKEHLDEKERETEYCEEQSRNKTRNKEDQKNKEVEEERADMEAKKAKEAKEAKDAKEELEAKKAKKAKDAKEEMEAKKAKAKAEAKRVRKEEKAKRKQEMATNMCRQWTGRGATRLDS
ncbi:hypothetical protein B0H34DRAFT_738046 [Crassisporium funariophilum]|nr:hypothetical protein B0H34DRAFT_738046 [Crassisporium funariophilum]